jgi:hypothetical protein
VVLLSAASPKVAQSAAIFLRRILSRVGRNDSPVKIPVVYNVLDVPVQCEIVPLTFETPD